MKQAIYKITNTKSGNFYIGSSINYQTRWREHKNSLVKNKHHCVALQRAYNRNNMDCFDFSVVEFVEDKNDLIKREQFYIDTLNPKYNSSKTAGSTLGFKMPKESVEKNKQRNSGFGNGNAKVTKDMLDEIIDMRKTHSQKQISERFGLHVTTIQRALKKYTDNDFKKIYNEETRAKISKQAKLRTNRATPVAMLDENKQLVRVFPSISAAARMVGRNVTTVHEAVCKGSKCAGHFFSRV